MADYSSNILPPAPPDTRCDTSDISITLPLLGEETADNLETAVDHMMVLALSSCASNALQSEAPPQVEGGGSNMNPVEPMVVQPKLTPCGTKFKLLVSGHIQVCRLNHTRTIVSKIMNSRYLRRWETHEICLGDERIESLTVSSLINPQTIEGS